MNNSSTKENGQLYRVSLLFVFSLFIIISLLFFGLSIGKPSLVINLAEQNGTWSVESVSTGGLASQAGITTGDIPVQINGKAAGDFLNQYQKSGLVFSPLIKELTVIDPRGDLKTASLAGSPLNWQSIISQAVLLVVCLIFWIIGLYVFIKKPKNIVALVFCLAGIAFGLVMSGNMGASIGVTAAAQVQIVATIIGPWLLFHFFLVLPDERARIRTNPLTLFIYLPAALTLLFFFR